MIANIGPIGLAILVVAALLTLVCLRRKPAPGAEPQQDEPWTRNAPKPRPMTGPAEAPESRDVQPHETRPYANGVVTLGEADRPMISARKEAAK